MGADLFAKVVISDASYVVDKLYDYKIPEPIQTRVKAGMRVIIPFARGNRKTEGIVLATTDNCSYENVKSIETVLDEEPVLNDELIKLVVWMREHFFCTAYDAVKAMLPAGLWFKNEVVYRVADGIDREAASVAIRGNKRAEAALDALFSAGGKLSAEELKEKLEYDSISSVMSSLISAGVVVANVNSSRRIQDKLVNTAVLKIKPEEALQLSLNKKKLAPMQSEVLKLLSEIGEASVKEISYFTGASNSVFKALEKSGAISLEKRESFRRPEYFARNEVEELFLNEEQSKVFNGIKKMMQPDKADAALLYGVTGSGKTAVYIRLISEVLAQNKTALVLVPEIALTPQMVSIFTAHFGDKVAVLHSSLSMGERYDEWKRIYEKKVDVVVGTRSAVFAPLSNLGIIIVDEEQEYTYKSENSPRYHAVDIAKYRCAKNRCLLLLGSATPSIESMYNAQIGRYHLFKLENRYNQRELPYVLMADMKKELRRGNGGSISSVLYSELKKNLDSGEQSILFINRRGSNYLVLCPECGFVCRCPNCSVNLTYHSANHRHICHYCGYSEPAQTKCPVCGSDMRFTGFGTQKVEEEIISLFPGVKLLRMDSDIVTASHSHDMILSQFEREKVQILVGTQMVAKGLNFENVTLVGVISADQSLYASDYRAQERTFSMITQVVGRSGRGNKAGRAVIQTFTPSNEILQFAASQDYDAFYKREIEVRNILHLPPMCDLVALTATGEDDRLLMRCCLEMKAILENYLSDQPGVEVLGPAPMSVFKVNKRYRYRQTIRCKENKKIRSLIEKILKYIMTEKKYKGILVWADINPFG